MKTWYEVQARIYDSNRKVWKPWQVDMDHGTLKGARAHRSQYESMVSNMGYKLGLQIVTRIVKCEVQK